MAVEPARQNNFMDSGRKITLLRCLLGQVADPVVPQGLASLDGPGRGLLKP